MKATQQDINVFIAYSRKDTSYLDKLRLYLKPLHRNKTIKIWYDGEIAPGTIWEEQIKTHLHQADIILLLVSAHSLASDYFYDREMSEAMERHDRNETIVVPVILSDCTWELTDLANLQALPKDGKPIVYWSDESSAYANIVRGLDKSIKVVKLRRNKSEEAIEFEKKQQAAIAQQQLQLEAQQKRKAQNISNKLKSASDYFSQGNYKKAIATANAVLKLDQGNYSAQQLKSDAQTILNEQKNANLNNVKSKTLKLGLPILGLLLLIFGLSKVNWSGDADDLSSATNANEIIAEDLGNKDTLNLETQSNNKEEEAPKTIINQPEQKKEPVKTNQEKYQDLINEANALFINHNYAEAKRKYQAALKINSKGTSAKNGIAKCEVALKPKTPTKKTEPKSATPTPEKNTTNKLPTPIQNLLNDMVTVIGGTFTMGCTYEQKDCGDDEKPTHPVTLSSFKIATYEVTQEQWRAVMGSDPLMLNFKGCDQCPVENVIWDDIQDFIKKLNSLTGKRFRLPTEAEWEFAARGGSKSKGYQYEGYQYAGGNYLKDVAWYGGNSDKKTHTVGLKQPNELGLYDMSGNVWEWCSDRYAKDYYSNSPTKNPKGASSGSRRVLRGGSYGDYSRYCRVSNRFDDYAGSRSNNIGFRVAQD